MASGYHVSTSVDSHPTVLVLQNGRKLETSGGWGGGCFLALPTSSPSSEGSLGDVQANRGMIMSLE